MSTTSPVCDALSWFQAFLESNLKRKRGASTENCLLPQQLLPEAGGFLLLHWGTWRWSLGVPTLMLSRRQWSPRRKGTLFSCSPPRAPHGGSSCPRPILRASAARRAVGPVSQMRKLRLKETGPGPRTWEQSPAFQPPPHRSAPFPASRVLPRPPRGCCFPKDLGAPPASPIPPQFRASACWCLGALPFP